MVVCPPGGGRSHIRNFFSSTATCDPAPHKKKPAPPRWRARLRRLFYLRRTLRPMPPSATRTAPRSPPITGRPVAASPIPLVVAVAPDTAPLPLTSPPALVLPPLVLPPPVLPPPVLPPPVLPPPVLPPPVLPPVLVPVLVPVLAPVLAPVLPTLPVLPV